MKIVLNGVQLTGDKPEEQPGDFRLNGRSEVEISRAIRSAEAVPTLSQNQANTISFSISREHANTGAAELFIFQHLIAIVNQIGRLELTCSDPDGGTTGVVYFTAVALSSWNMTFSGASTVISYQLTAGQANLQVN